MQISALELLHTEMKEAQRQYEAAEERYDEANLASSPFKAGERIIYRGTEYQIDRVSSGPHCTTNCLAFPIKKYGDVGITKSVVIYSDVSVFTLKGKTEVNG